MFFVDKKHDTIHFFYNFETYFLLWIALGSLTMV